MKGLIWVTNTAIQDLANGNIRFVNEVRGEPKASNRYTSEQLSSMGMIGIYRREGDESFRSFAKDQDEWRW